MTCRTLRLRWDATEGDSSADARGSGARAGREGQKCVHWDDPRGRQRSVCWLYERFGARVSACSYRGSESAASARTQAVMRAMTIQYVEVTRRVAAYGPIRVRSLAIPDM